MPAALGTIQMKSILPLLLLLSCASPYLQEQSDFEINAADAGIVPNRPVYYCRHQLLY